MVILPSVTSIASFAMFKASMVTFKGEIALAYGTGDEVIHC